ncbi:hypothetical protein [Marinobacter sp. LV10R520-4]|uniref:hypothetical protein n=1 Tax=Marinobacter sp. LV10R520-4 TaxID=1761796 RepID=UPI000BF4AF84|nr:hypothetical protein [Marinobacter sp. LV10R520-4]
MFESLKQLPQDPILQLMQMFRDDTRPDKVDLGVGVYKDDTGKTPIMAPPSSKSFWVMTPCAPDGRVN